MATRNIKDAKDLSTGELIYFKGHAQATFMSDGRTVEEAINNIDTSGGESDENVVKGIMTESGNINGIVLPDGRELYIGNGSIKFVCFDDVYMKSKGYRGFVMYDELLQNDMETFSSLETAIKPSPS